MTRMRPLYLLYRSVQSMLFILLTASPHARYGLWAIWDLCHFGIAEP